MAALSAAIIMTGTASASLRLDCGPIRLAFDPASGQWAGLWRAGLGVNLFSPGDVPDVEIHVADGPGFPGPGRRLVAHGIRREAGHWRVEIETVDGPWRVTCFYDVESDPPLIRRSVSIRWSGPQLVKITGVTLRAPSIGFGGGGGNFYLLPSDFPVQRHPFRDFQSGRRATEEGVMANTGEAVVYSPRHKVGIIAGYQLDVDGARVVVEEGAGTVSVAHEFSTVARLAPGESLDCGQQCLLVASGSWDDALAGLRCLSDSLNNGPPRDRPAWLDRCAIYSCYPGGSIDTGFRGAGGFADFEQRLPYLAGLGFTALWLNPIHTPAAWIYGIGDYRAIAPALGTEGDLKRFVARSHRLGMKVLLDLVPHGPNEDTPAARDAPPEAWTYDESGKLEHAWGGLAGDYASRAWKTYMSDIAAYWVRGFSVDGYRVDCAGGNGPNWKRGDGRRPSVSSPLGGLELLQSVRDTIRPLNRDAALFPESWAPIFFRSGDLVYDYPFYQVMRRLVTYPSTEEWIRDARAWLQMERLTYPQLALPGLVRFLENHDTVRSDELFGVGPAQALTALCIFAQGTPMIYQDQEIGFGVRLKQWMDLRQTCAELHSGDADYEAVRCSSPGVLAFLRRGNSRAAVVAINFTSNVARARLEWPAELGSRFPFAYNGASGNLVSRNGASATVAIPPYEPVVLLLRARAAGASGRGGSRAAQTHPRSPVAHTGTQPTATAGPLLVRQDRQASADGTTERRVRLAPAKYWFVNTSEGLLLDEFVDRHTVEAITRYERLWRPLEAGLWDGPGAPAMGVIAADGRGVISSDFRLDLLTSPRVEDSSDHGSAVEIIVRARGKERPFVVREVVDGWAAVRALRLAVGRGYQAPFGRPIGAFSARRGAPLRAPQSGRAAAEGRPYGMQRDSCKAPTSPFPENPLLSIDPIRVVLQNDHYRVVLSRRRGGLISGLGARSGAALTDVPVLGSDVYTDWGLYEGGAYVGAQWEATPRLEITHSADTVEVTFRGLLRTASWNGVQRGYPAQPLARYRITYRADASPALRVTFALTPESDRADVKAFFAYLLQFGNVTEWFADTEKGRVSGRPGQHSGNRAFQTVETKLAPERPEMGVRANGSELIVRPVDSGGLPQNVFFLDQGPERLALFVAMLNGDALSLPAGVERAVSFDLTFKAAQPTARPKP